MVPVLLSGISIFADNIVMRAHKLVLRSNEIVLLPKYYALHDSLVKILTRATIGHSVLDFHISMNLGHRKFSILRCVSSACNIETVVLIMF